MSRFLALIALVACDAGAKPTPPPTPAPAAPKAPVPPLVPIVAAPVLPPSVLSKDHVLLASIERTACYGRCPIYTVSVYRDGKVEYVGKEYVKKKGKVASSITAAQVNAIDKLFTDAHYVKLANAYTSYDVTDNPSANTTYRPLGAATKKVAHYYGDSHAPDALTTLEEDFDKLLTIDRWIGTRAERDHLGG